MSSIKRIESISNCEQHRIPKRVRLKNGSSILNYIHHFSATEKAIFGVLVAIAGISALVMAGMVNDSFMTVIPSHGGELREGVLGLPHMKNPVLAGADVDSDISSLVFSGLMKYSNGNLVPDLAESYDISTDGLTYSFKLRPNLTFSDGSPLTTDDIAYTIQKIQDVALKSPHRADWNNVSVVTTSPTEIKFVLKQPYSPFITNTTIGILPKHIWNNLTDDQFNLSENNVNPIGSGPYKLKSPGLGIPKEYNLIASSRYYGEAPFVGTITFVFFSDSDKAFSALESGTIDSMASISAEQAGIITSDYSSKYSIISSPLPRIFGVFFNQSNNPVLADANVRQALDMAVDRSQIVNKVLNGYGLAVHGPLPFGMNTGSSSIDVTTNTSNLAGASAILEKGGWKKNPATGIYEKKGLKNVIQTLSFDIYTADTPDLKNVAESVKNSWNALGANVTVKIFDTSDLYQNIIRTRKYDALLFGQLIGKAHDLYAFWNSSQRNAPGLNVAMYANTKVDTLLDNIRSTNDDSLRKTEYASLDQMIRADIPAVFLYSPDFIYAVPKTLKNTDGSSFNINNITIPADRWNSISNWYVTTQKVWKIFANNNLTNK